MNGPSLGVISLVERIYFPACYLDYFYTAGTVGMAAKGYFMAGNG